MIYLEGKDGWHRHPFTISSAPHEGVVRVTVKALGDYTSRLQEIIEPGMPAVIGGPHGRFGHWKGTDRQVWIAGGVGVAPFLSWLRGLERASAAASGSISSTPLTARRHSPRRSSAIAGATTALRTHLIDTSVEGRLTTERVLASVGGDAERPVRVPMWAAGRCCARSRRSFAQAGVPSRRIHREYFDWR